MEKVFALFCFAGPFLAWGSGGNVPERSGKANIVEAGAQLKPARLGDVKLTGWIGGKAENFFRERITGDWARNVMMKEAEDAFIARKDDAGPLGLWQGEFWGKTMIGFAQMSEYKRDEELRRFVRESAGRIMSLQESDGYIGTYTNKLFLRVEPTAEERAAKRWRSKHNWNIWCRSFTALGLLEAAKATGDAKILEAGARSMLQLIGMLHDNGISITDTGTNAGMPSCTVINPMLAYYEATGDRRFLDFAEEIIAKWDRDENIPPNFFRNVDSGKSPYHWYEGAPFQFDWPKVNELLMCMQGLCDYARITGDARSLQVAEKMFRILRKHERNSIFTIGYNDRCHQASTIPTAVTETCDTVMWIVFLKKLYLMTGKAEYADELEVVYLNPFLAGMTRDGKWGNRGVRSHCRHGAAGRHAGMKYNHCCVNNIPRGFMEFAESVLAKDRDGAYRIAFYTDVEAKMGDLEIAVGGNWPVGDVAKVDVRGVPGTRLKFRKPAWSQTMLVDGKSVDAAGGWWETAVPPDGKLCCSFAFDLSPRIVPLEAKPDPQNASMPFEVRKRWLIYDKWDIMPYFHAFDLVRVMRGPLLIAKSTRTGANEDEVFGWGRARDDGSIKVEMEPLDGYDVWGAWKVSLSVTKGAGCERYFSVNACDFQSAGDSHDVCPAKTFCIFF